MNASNEVYPVGHCIPIAFYVCEPVQAELLKGFKTSFGEKYARDEDIEPQHRRSLTVFPGGLREVRR